MPSTPFPLLNLLRATATLESSAGTDYLAGAGRRMMTTVEALERQVGIPLVLWARPAEARMPTDQGGLATETLLLISCHDLWVSVIDEGVMQMEGENWDHLLEQFVARWHPNAASYWHYVHAATRQRRVIEDWLPAETGLMADKVAEVVARAHIEWMDNATGQATGSTRKTERL